MSLPLYTRPDTTDDPDVLFLHGFLGSGRDWSDLAQDFPLHCLAPDLPGHGKSVGLTPQAYTMEGAAKSVLDVLDGKGIQTCHVAGYSMGGRLALYLALRHPERVKTLLLESASPGLKTEKERAARRGSDKELACRLEAADKGGFRAFLEEWHRQPLFASLADHRGLVERLVSERKNNDPAELAKSLRGMGAGSQPSLWKELPGLEVPTLAVTGEYDRKFVSIAREMSELSPNIERVVISKTGHNVHLERPEEFARLLGSFAGED